MSHFRGGSCPPQQTPGGCAGGAAAARARVGHRGAGLCLRCPARGLLARRGAGTGLGTDGSAASSGHGWPHGMGSRLCPGLCPLCPGTHPLPCSLLFLSALAVPSLGSATPLAQLCCPSRLCPPLPSSLFCLLAPCSLPSSLQVSVDAAEAQGCRGAAGDPGDGLEPVPAPCQATVTIQAFARGPFAQAIVERWEPSRAGGVWVSSGGASGVSAPKMVWCHEAVAIQAPLLVQHCPRARR